MENLWNDSTDGLEVINTELKELSLVLPETLTKTNLKVKSLELRDKLNLSNISNPIRAYIRLYAFKMILEDIETDLKELAIAESFKYKDDKIIDGVGFTYKNGASKFDYSSDKTWNELKSAIKEREEFLKGLKKPMADTETGEIIAPPMITYSKDSITISIPK